MTVFDLCDTQLKLCKQHLDLLEKWNKIFNLTAIRNREEMDIKHLYDSLAVLPYLPQSEHFNMLDVGTGGGFPGIPLAISRPNWHFTLIDCSIKKIRFLKHVCTELGLSNVIPLHIRIEQFQPNEKFDGIISRAFASIDKMIQLSQHTLKDKGRFYAMKGPETETITNANVMSKTPLVVPGLKGERFLYNLSQVSFFSNHTL